MGLLTRGLRVWRVMSRVMLVVTWGLVTGLGIYMLGRGVWALQQPWGSTVDKLVGLGFFAVLTCFAAYRLIIHWRTATNSASLTPPPENVAYGVGSLAFAIGGAFILLRGLVTGYEQVAAVAGVLFFGGAGVFFLTRGRHS